MEIGNNAAKQLLSYVHRIERTEEEKKEISEVLKDLYSEAKANGYDVKALKAIIKMRKQDPEEVQQLEEAIDIYKKAINEAEKK